MDTLEPEDAEAKPRNLITAALDVPNTVATFELFIGPKEHERLAQLGPGLEHVIEYGSWMKYMALPLRKGLLWIHGFVGNYGWSIVLLTVLINIVLIPLKHHSYVSMRKMQKLSPQIKKIQERFKKLKPTDPKQQDKNKEVYALYKEHNVSPMSGCLPMVLMIPFFFAFYRLLMVSIELRHAPFAFWIQDLSTNDPYFVLPVLMGVTQVGIQRMSPQTSADPVQAKMMMFMPVLFIFILAWAPAGLVLYWFVNNLVSIGQQTVTNRYIKNEKKGGDSQKSGGGKSRKNKNK
jgi:YidC/Oxa1 family membrane protein insertase